MAKTERVKTGLLQGAVVAIVCGVVLMLTSVASNAAAGRAFQSQVPDDPCVVIIDDAGARVPAKEDPCATTTIPERSTTSTTEAERTTTTLARETTTTTEARETTTTEAEETTTTGAVSPGTVSRPQSGTLARTGSDNGGLVLLGLGLVLAGSVVVLGVHRAQRAHS